MCNPPIITPSSSFESISSYSPSSPSTGKRNHMRRGMSFRSMSNSYGRYQQENHFLESCFFCKTKLYLGDDIYMYKGDTPFCSQECRQDQIETDEMNEKMKSKMSLKKAVKPSKIDGVQMRTVATTVFA